VQYVNKAWSDACGWSAEEVLGLDCKFLQGEATSVWSIAKFMRKISDVNFDGQAELEVLNYKKDGTLMKNNLVCVPVGRNPGSPVNNTLLDCEEHLVCISELTDCFGSVEKTTSKSSRYNPMWELGMPIDRREQSNAYSHLGKHPAPKVAEWAIISGKLTLPLTMQYMLETQAAAVLVDSDGRMIHMNPAWAQFMNCRMKDVEGLPFDMFVHDFTQPDQLEVLHRMFENGNDLDRFEYSNLVLDAGAAKRRNTQGGWCSAPVDANELWPCAMSAARVSDDVRLVMTLWVRDTPLAASQIMLTPQVGHLAGSIKPRSVRSVNQLSMNDLTISSYRSKMSHGSLDADNLRGSLDAFGYGTPTSTTAMGTLPSQSPQGRSANVSIG
jgi:PAS domain-containing protein